MNGDLQRGTDWEAESHSGLAGSGAGSTLPEATPAGVHDLRESGSRGQIRAV